MSEQGKTNVIYRKKKVKLSNVPTLGDDIQDYKIKVKLALYVGHV